MGETSALATAALILHTLSAVVWVGGMLFAHQILRPAAAALDPGPRLLLWSRVLGRFFAWVIAAIVLLLATGYILVLGVLGGFSRVGLHVNVMQGIGILMMLLFFHLYFAPWRRFRLAVGREDWAERRVLSEDASLELPELRARLEPELVGEPLPPLAVDL